jgi:AraC-like DNA-binding protein
MMHDLGNATQRPLDAFPLMRTRDLDVMRAGYARLFVDSKFDLSSRAPIEAWVNHMPLQTISLHYGTYAAAIGATFGDVNFFIQGIPLLGDGEQVTNRETAAVHQDRGGVLSPGDRIRLKFAAGFEHLSLIFDPKAVTSKLGALTGGSLNEPLRFQAETDFCQPAAGHLRRLVKFLVDELTATECRMPFVGQTELEQLLIVYFLHGNQHNYSHLLDGRPRSAAPWQVRRTEDYIAAHWDQPITIESLALATGASTRSIFHSFKESRGYSPMAFLKNVRLQHARDMLQNAVTNTSVTDVAYACAFNNLGHFAKDYVLAFGERPSETLNYAKGARRSKGRR